MKKTTIFLFLIIFGFLELQAQDTKLKNNIAIGYQVNQYQNDFGFGLNLTSPYFSKDRLAIRLRGNYMTNNNVYISKSRSSTYTNFSVGVVGVGGMIGERMRLYGEGGILIINASKEISTVKTPIGAYGIFGYEFFLSNKLNYFIELGGTSINAKADKTMYSPTYSNGFLTVAGLRYTL